MSQEAIFISSVVFISGLSLVAALAIHFHTRWYFGDRRMKQTKA